MIKRRKLQSCLDSFLGIEDHRVPSIFHLDWENKVATFLHKKPLGVCWEEEFVWKSENRYMLITSTCTTQKPPQNSLDKYSKAMIPLLKSHLQKTTRRGNSDLAVRTSKHLINLDLNVFLRRWTIILLEDSMIHFKYPVLVWLMIAVSKGFYPCNSILGWILGHVEATVCYPVQLDYKNYPIESVVRLESKSITRLPCLELNLVYSLQLRQAYGGMKGDSQMIQDITLSLLDSIDENGNLSKTITENLSFPIHTLDYSTISDLELNEWELAAIDFHVSDIINQWWNLISESDKNKWTRDDLQSCMWECCGSINHRRPSKSVYSSLWSKYASKVKNLAQSILIKKMKIGK